MAERREGRATRSARAWAQLLAGLFGFGLAISVMIRSGLGLGPWDAFHVGVSLQTGISIGAASIAAGLAIVLGSLWIGIRPGPGTLANMVLIGVFIDLTLPVVPRAGHRAAGLAMYVAAIAACGLATGFYIGAGLGKGPRDGLIVGLARRTGRGVGPVRTLVELAALACGWAMGARIGVGTLLFALGIGPAMQWGMRVCGADERRPPAAAEP